MMMRTFILIIVGLAVSISGTAQSYSTALGLRLSNGSNVRQAGFTIQHRLAKRVTAEGIFQTNFAENHTLHLIGQHHRPIISKRLNWYYGGGVSLGVEESYIKDPETNQKTYTYGNKTVGIDAIAGLEFTLLKLNLSWDIKPNFNLAGRTNWMTLQTGISIRSVLVTSAQQKKKKRKRERVKRQ